MKAIYKCAYRTYQGVFKLAAYVLPWRKPELLKGKNSLQLLPQNIKSMNISNVLIVTDKGISKLGLMDNFLNDLREMGIQYFIYGKTEPNPTSTHVEEALELYKANNCQGIIAFGGGSPIDCGKAVGARIARPKKSLDDMRGLLRVRKKMPPFFAVPTTAGTGSEATIAAVITDPDTHIKYQINDLSLIPYMAVLDPQLTIGLPPNITATTGMDALTHAVEAYIGNYSTKETRILSKRAVKLIFSNIYTSYSDGENITSRNKMLFASYYGGLAFTRAYIGYVHGMAHALGGLYGIPHGLANAVILPYVLEYYGKSVYKKLGELADAAGIGANLSDKEKAEKFISEIRELNRKMNIPEKIQGINKKDIPLLVDRVLKESNPTYPTPKTLFKEDFVKLFNIISL